MTKAQDLIHWFQDPCKTEQWGRGTGEENRNTREEVMNRDRERKKERDRQRQGERHRARWRE